MKKKDREILRAWTLVLQIGISMMVPVFVGFFLGKWLDERLGTGFLMPVFLGLGMLAAFRNTYLLLKGYLAQIRKEDEGK
ncbi:MAG: AtpZ/AtpI family protein [Lachnospiraceae bacterium]|nr:AtpZ/AtpI family protein [Lachnospiraceae bacterium]MBQ9592976.1 AtpZ/AtpI family protein [Lachnospiraceae bacterium]